MRIKETELFTSDKGVASKASEGQLLAVSQQPQLRPAREHQPPTVHQSNNPPPLSSSAAAVSSPAPGSPEEKQTLCGLDRWIRFSKALSQQPARSTTIKASRASSFGSVEDVFQNLHQQFATSDEADPRDTLELQAAEHIYQLSQYSARLQQQLAAARDEAERVSQCNQQLQAQLQLSTQCNQQLQAQLQMSGSLQPSRVHLDPSTGLSTQTVALLSKVAQLEAQLEEMQLQLQSATARENADPHAAVSLVSADDHLLRSSTGLLIKPGNNADTTTRTSIALRHAAVECVEAVVQQLKLQADKSKEMETAFENQMYVLSEKLENCELEKIQVLQQLQLVIGQLHDSSG